MRLNVSNYWKYQSVAADISSEIISGVQVELLEPGAEAEWNGYVDDHLLGSSAHLVEWKGLIEHVFGKKTYYLVARSEGRIVGVLPLVHMHSLLFGNFMVSVPYLNYGGILADDTVVEQRLMAEAASLAKGLAAKSIEYREQVEKISDMPCRTDKVSMILQLPASEAELSKQLGSKLRSQIKRPLRENPEVSIGKMECLNDFYEVFARNMRDLGTPVYGKYFFKEILRAFHGAYIVTIKLQGRPVAAAFLLGYRNTLEIPWASTIRDVNHLSMNMLLYWEVLCSAIAKKYERFDFGRSTVDAGTYRFKKQWGAEPKQLYWRYEIFEGGNMPGLTTSNPKFRLAIQVWQRMPVILTKYLGPLVVKHLP